MHQRHPHSLSGASLGLSSSLNAEQLEDNILISASCNSFQRADKLDFHDFDDTDCIDQEKTLASKHSVSSDYPLQRITSEHVQSSTLSTSVGCKQTSSCYLPLQRTMRSLPRSSVKRKDSTGFYDEGTGWYPTKSSMGEVYEDQTRSFFLHTTPLNLFRFSPPPACLSSSDPITQCQDTEGLTWNTMEECRKGIFSCRKSPPHLPHTTCRMLEGCHCQRPLIPFAACGCPNEWTHIDMNVLLPPFTIHSEGMVPGDGRRDEVEEEKDAEERRERTGAKPVDDFSRGSSVFPGHTAQEGPSPHASLTPFSFVSSRSSSSYSSYARNFEPSLEAGGVGEERGEERSSTNRSYCPACPPPQRTELVRETPFVSTSSLRLTIPPPLRIRRFP